MTGQIPIGEDDLQAYVDGRLTAERAVIVEAYLQGQPKIRAQLLRDALLRDTLSQALQGKYDEPIPARLRVAAMRPGNRGRYRTWFGQSAAAALLLCIGGGLGWYANMARTKVSASPIHIMTVNAVAAYLTYTPEVRHPVEVSTGNDGHLTQWLSNRLRRPVIIPDLQAEGFSPMGGRVLPTANTPAAQIMYHDAQGGRLTFYLEPMAAGITDFRYTESNGVRTYYRAENGVAFAVTAKIDRDKLLAVAQDIDNQMGAGAAPLNHD